jgi:hypothetical protein
MQPHRPLPDPSLLPRLPPIRRGSLKDVTSKLGCLQGNSGRLFECSKQQRWQSLVSHACKETVQLEETQETREIDPRAAQLSVSRSLPWSEYGKRHNLGNQFKSRHNIELSRPAVRSPAATQFTFPIPRYTPAVPGSASTTCYAQFEFEQDALSFASVTNSMTLQ